MDSLIQLVKDLGLHQHQETELHTVIGALAVLCHSIGYSPVDEIDLIELVLTHMNETRRR